MGIFSVRVRFYSLPDRAKGHELEVTVDTGATYSVIPRRVAEALDVLPIIRHWFVLANGERISREVGHLGVEYEGRQSPAPVVLGQPEDPPLLGAVALEELGYETDPVAKTLRPATRFLMRFEGGRPAEAIGT